MVRLAVGGALLALSYLLFAGQASADEIGFGLGCVVLATLWGELVLRAAPDRLQLRGEGLIVALRALSALPARTLAVGVALARATLGARVEGVVAARRFEAGRRDSPEDAGRRAVVVLGLSLTPDSFVVDLPPQRDRIDLHRLVAGSEHGDARWPA